MLSKGTAPGRASMGALAALAAAAAAQPSNHIGEPLAQIMVRHGCAMAEGDIAEAMRAEGYVTSDFQAQVLALYRGGHLVSAPDGALKLVKWEPCP